MPRRSSTAISRCALLLATWLAVNAPAQAAEGGKALTFVDLMKMRAIEEPAIADNGAWVAYALVPDRGDGELVVRSTTGEVEYRAARGRAPLLTPEGAWVAARIEPTLAEKEQAEAKDKGEKKGKGEEDEPKPGLLLLTTADGARETFERVEGFAFSADGRYLARHHAKAEEKDDGAEDSEEASESAEEPTAETPPAEETTAEPAGDEDERDEEEVGTRLVLRALASGEEITFEHVDTWAFDDAGRFLAWVVRAPGGEGNGVFVLPLDTPDAEAIAVVEADGGRMRNLTWTDEPRSDLAFVAEEPAEEATDQETSDDSGPPSTALWLWHGSSRSGEEVTASADAPEGWYLPAENGLTFSQDGQRLFFGYRPRNDWIAPDDEEDDASEDGEPFDAFDTESLLEQATLDLWHTDDPLIMTNQRERFEEESKRLYAAVYHRPETARGRAKRRGEAASGRVVPLADTAVRDVEPTDNPHAVLARTDVPYLKERTWDGFFQDFYWISLRDGSRHQVAERLPRPASLSPDGRFVVFYREPHWYLFDSEDFSTRSLTADLDVPFADEDHDYPRAAPSYGVADWLEDASAVLIHDKYDVWSFPTADGAPHRITGGEGRGQRMIYRLVDTDPERDFVRAGESLLLTGYHDRQKHQGLFSATPNGDRTETLLPGEGETVSVIGKAKDAGRLLLTRESYRQFPDLWTAGLDLQAPRRLSDANPEIDTFAWGDAELVAWLDLDGQPLQGVLIKPEGWQPGQRCPLLVYFYRFFSQRMHRFNDLAVNHRPSFPLYAGDGYAIFLPDIRFEIGRPGLSAVKALVPGVQKLIEMGVVDPDAIGLHGHSWSGYQTAFAITQTHIFKAAVAGAPVSNMTSAYSGIRWGSGLARQFQYEKSQSRLGKSLWEARDRYIDNSPVFFADRIETPLLIMFGDEDDAVPWYQGIELYLAMRRLGKDAVFLQYRGEPHHLKKYPNKLDYATRMKAFFDHHLKGEPAPAWLIEGVPYRGD